MLHSSLPDSSILSTLCCILQNMVLSQDEPTSGLDATAATEILAALRRCEILCH